METIHIPVWRSFVNWIAVVILGSCIAPSLLKAHATPASWTDGETVLGFMAVSAVFSLPALLVFILSNWAMNKRRLRISTYRGRQFLIHLGISVMTFGVIGISGDEFDDMDFTIKTGLTYTILGQLAWWITFLSHRKKEQKPVAREELLDDL
jgi:hypothetical protein